MEKMVEDIRCFFRSCLGPLNSHLRNLGFWHVFFFHIDLSDLNVRFLSMEFPGSLNSDYISPTTY